MKWVWGSTGIGFGFCEVDERNTGAFLSGSKILLYLSWDEYLRDEENHKTEICLKLCLIDCASLSFYDRLKLRLSNLDYYK